LVSVAILFFRCLRHWQKRIPDKHLFYCQVTNGSKEDTLSTALAACGTTPEAKTANKPVAVEATPNAVQDKKNDCAALQTAAKSVLKLRSLLLASSASGSKQEEAEDTWEAIESTLEAIYVRHRSRIKTQEISSIKTQELPSVCHHP
jgi:hypothetical protein